LGVEAILIEQPERATPAKGDDAMLPFAPPAVGRKKITAAFDGGRLAADGGGSGLLTWRGTIR
jgi:hypothetical protein